MRTARRVVAGATTMLVLSGCGMPSSSDRTPAATGPCPHEALGAAEGMASVKVGFDEGTRAFGSSAELRLCPFGFTGASVALVLPAGVTSTPAKAVAGADGAPVVFAVTVTAGSSGPITWRVGSKAEGLAATGNAPSVVAASDGWHFQLAER